MKDKIELKETDNPVNECKSLICHVIQFTDLKFHDKMKSKMRKGKEQRQGNVD